MLRGHLSSWAAGQGPGYHVNITTFYATHDMKGLEGTNYTALPRLYLPTSPSYTQ